LITIVVEDDFVDNVVESIISVNKTGKPGDGKIFILPLGDAVRVRTGESGMKSIS
jgi:nitrogen regulatory protein PII 2